MFWYRFWLWICLMGLNIIDFDDILLTCEKNENRDRRRQFLIQGDTYLDKLAFRGKHIRKLISDVPKYVELRVEHFLQILIAQKNARKKILKFEKITGSQTLTLES